MKVQTALAALALAAFATIASAEITGKVTLDGKAPEQKEIDMSGVKECAALHADPVTEESIVADDKGGLDAHGHVGACHRADCRHNDHLECTASDVEVGAGVDPADCLTFAPA